MKDRKLDVAVSEVKAWPITDSEFNAFNDKLDRLVFNVKTSIDNRHNENAYVTHFQNFLHDTFYGEQFFSVIPVNDTDLAIQRDSKNLVLFELKKPQNVAEMVKKDNLNKKAFWELVWYFLEDTRYIENSRAIKKQDVDIRRLLITNCIHFFEFEAAEFEKLIESDNQKIVKIWINCKNSMSIDSRRPHFYEKLEAYLNEVDVLERLPFTFFSLLDETKTIGRRKLLFRFFSKDYLIKEKRDYIEKKHELKKPFYNELLYIMGLIETVDPKTKKQVIIINHENNEMLAPQIYKVLTEDRGMTTKKATDYCFQLVVTWINRLLFLKLFEGLLIDINGPSIEYKILDNSKIHSFSELNNVFFDVLGQRIDERESNSFYNSFSKIPYLNSSLFERTDAEYDTISIKNINNCIIHKYARSVVNEETELSLLQYIFRFLSCWKFSTYESELDSNDRSIIDASVLGLIFEKINGYQDGSFYTPTQITEFIAFETLTKTVLNKAGDYFHVNFNNLLELKDWCSEHNKRKNLI